MTSRRSFTPDSTGEIDLKTDAVCSATSRARVVLPLPGGPQRIIECRVPEAAIWVSSLPGPSKCSWPTASSSVRGRIRSASGCPREGLEGNRLAGCCALRDLIVEALAQHDERANPPQSRHNA